MNDEYHAASLLIFIIHHSSFIIKIHHSSLIVKTETPPDTCVSQAACVGETSFAPSASVVAPGALRVTPHAAARMASMSMMMRRCCVEVLSHALNVSRMPFGARPL
jgi:hypothetical protein